MQVGEVAIIGGMHDLPSGKVTCFEDTLVDNQAAPQRIAHVTPPVAKA